MQKIEIEYEDVIIKRKHPCVMVKTVFMMTIKDDSNGRNNIELAPCISKIFNIYYDLTECHPTCLDMDLIEVSQPAQLKIAMAALLYPYMMWSPTKMES